MSGIDGRTPEFPTSPAEAVAGATPEFPTVKRIAVVAAGLSQPSSTRLLADRLADATVERMGEHGVRVEVTAIELRDLAHDITNNLLTGFPSPKLQQALDAVTGSDGLIAVTPIFTTSYSGLFKSFVDVLDPQSLTDLPVLIGATGGTSRHSLALDYAIRPVFTYLHAVVAPTGVFAASEDWGAGGESSLPDRIGRAAREFAALVRESTRDGLNDPFRLPAGFNPIGAFGAN
ncbi:FMN reductase [Diaminobutyricimonas aerilata]|uniref:FMN reductase n=1 Tax=Diaminobutyricimonas aerilata TaxID=1162967 RepID=A0A2M9CKY9_9MICO|nr:FMN reductase [Diaminobutyricimonas aerilata]PJJ72547.1 FMN reductase [Diaminobutyricimonas aerilata]